MILIVSELLISDIKVIQKIAREGSCVLVGRCADYVLKNDPSVVSVFITASLNSRIATVCSRNGVSEEKAKEMIRKVDKTRASYYNYYTERKWGKADVYDLCVSTENIGIHGAVEVIYRYLECLNDEKNKKKE